MGYLFLYESGDMSYEENVTEEDLTAVDDGILDVIDVSEGNDPMRYGNGAWHAVLPFSLQQTVLPEK